MSAPFPLTTSQRESLQRLVQSVQWTLDQQARRDIEDDWSQVFAFVGPRGSGKSTLLREVGRLVANPARARGDVHVVPSLDCTALPARIPPPAAVLMRIASDEQLWQRNKEAQPGASEHLRNELKSLAGAHVKAGASYRDLCQELSTAPDEFPEYLMEGVQARFALRSAVASCLASVVDLARVKLLLVGLDDFDLVPTRSLVRWRAALLETLRQPHLAFVLTADVLRLERSTIEDKEPLDAATAQAVWTKLLPPRNRVAVPGLDRDWRQFRPAWAQDASPLTTRLDRWMKGARPWLRPLVEQLVPRRPRGLVHLHESLSPTGEFDALLLILAACRSDDAVSRIISSAREHGVARLLGNLRKRSAGHRETWAQVVAASAPAADDEDLAPLRPLALRGDALGSVRDPKARAFWTELLVDVALDRPVERGALLERWDLLRERSTQACFSVTLQPNEWASLLESSQRALLPWIAWSTSQDEDPSAVLAIGWAPLVAHLRQTSPAWPTGLLQMLRVGPVNLHGDLALRGPATDLAILPASVRSIVLLIDALSRCPWQVLSGPRLGWQPMTYLQLAALMVRTAFVRALRVGCTNLGQATQAMQAVYDDHGPLLEVLERSDPWLPQRAGDHSLAEVNALSLPHHFDDRGLRAALQQCPHHPLIDAALAYLDLPAYRALAGPLERM